MVNIPKPRSWRVGITFAFEQREIELARSANCRGSSIQDWNRVDDLAHRDLLLDIGTEELRHLDVVGALVRFTS